MSSNGSPSRTEINVKRARKSTEPQRIPVSCESSIPMNPSPGNPLGTLADSQLAQVQAAAAAIAGASVQGTNSDQTMNILNLASAIAVNSLLAMNQQQATLSQLAPNPILANAAKMMLGMNSLLNQADRPPPNPTEILSMINAQQQESSTSVASLQQAMLIQQYAAAAMARQSAGIPSPHLAALHMSLKRSLDNGQNERKRSLPADISDEEMRKRVYSDSRAFQIKQSERKTAQVPVSKDDMERCLNKILNEEIYNIFEDDLKPEIMETSPSMGTDENSKDMSGSMSPIERKMSIDEILDIISTRSIRDENVIVSVGSAFRKVSSRSLLVEPPRTNGIGSPQIFTGRNEYLNWTTSVSPPDSSPKSEADLAPLSQEIVIQLRDLALAHRVEDSSSIDQELVLTRDEQLKRFPVVWQGALSMKHWETAVQMHLVTGSTEMLIKCLGDSNVEAKNAVTIKIEQRMRLDNTQVQSVVNKMADMTQFACMICLPCGLSRDEILSNSATFQTAFIDYFTQKGAAGIANIPAKSSTAGCLVHVFPPGDFPSSYLSFYSPQLFESITSRQASYLFVVLTPEERAA